MDNGSMTIYNPAAMFGETINIDLGDGRILTVEFLEPNDADHLIDIAASVTGFDGEEPEDLVVLRPTKETVEILDARKCEVE